MSVHHGEFLQIDEVKLGLSVLANSSVIWGSALD